jgi:hypothetical protein
MKIAATLAALVAAEDVNWPGQSLESTCGSLITAPTGDSAINATCEVTYGDGFEPHFVSIPNAFWLSDLTFTSFDGVGSADASVEVLVFWRQGLDDNGDLDNSTCPLDADDLARAVTIECKDNGAPALNENLIGNFAFAPDNNNYQVPVANPSANFAADLSAFGGDDVNGFTCNGDALSVSGSSINCAFEGNGQLGYFGFNGTTAPDLPNSYFPVNDPPAEE